MRTPLRAALFLVLASSTARAEPYRLRADGVGMTQEQQSPVGLLVLQGEDKTRPWIDTEALIWAGNASSVNSSAADALVLMVRLHDPQKWGELRLGRQILSAGAVRPVHLDGVRARGRLPSGTSLEVFGGVPVQSQLAYRPYEWVTGARVAQTIGWHTAAGASYLQQRDGGRVAFEEFGVDVATAPISWFDLAVHGAYDLTNPGVTEAGASLSSRLGKFRPEVYFKDRSPSRLLPATSLFSALGDTPAQVFGGSVLWRMFPRLDLLPIAAARVSDGDAGFDGTLRTTLRLDDRGEGALIFDLRRQDSSLERWTGVRAAARVPLTPRWRVSTEIELVAPDDSRGRGSVWPWALAALRWLPARQWEVAGAVEAASTPKNASELNAMLRLTRTWGPQ